MRYFRMFVVVNLLITGLLRSAETPQPEGAFAGGDEEPPERSEGQAVVDIPVAPVEVHEALQAAIDQPQQLALPAVHELGPVPTESQKTEQVVAPTAPVSIEPVIPPVETAETPTIEDAEQVIEDHAHGHASEESIPPFPVQPGVVPAGLPVEPVAHVASPTLEESVEEKSRGIDTVGLEQPQGNWLFKRYWWERAEEVYKKIRTHVEKINDIRVKFFARRTELDKTILDPFYADVGLTQGELQTSIQSLMAQLEQEREHEGVLNEEERTLMEAVQKDRDRLEQLQRDIRGVGALRDAADKIVDRIMDQKNRVVRYETEAWDAMREIGRIVSDTQASELYYRMDAGWRTVKDIYRYIDQDLSRYFDKLLVNAREQTERIKTVLQALKEQGVDLKARIQHAQEQEVQKELAQEEEEKQKKVTKPQATGWFASTSRIFQAVIDVALWQFLQSIWDIIMWLPRRIYSAITSLFR